MAPATGQGRTGMRVLVIGGSGFIGRYLVRRLSGIPSHEVSATYLSRHPPEDGNSWHRLDLPDAESLEGVFLACRPEVVVHLAAMADVGTAERAPQRAQAVNVDGTAEIVRLCRRNSSRLVFMSTEYVLDGHRGPYSEDATPNPTTQYGRTKLQAEQRVEALGTSGCIVRTSIVYGWPLQEHRNFVPMLVERLRSGQPYGASTSVMRSPVYVNHLVDGIEKLVERHHPGVHHIAGRDWVSMYDFAVAVAAEFGLDRELVVPEDDAGLSSSGDDRLGLDCSRTMQMLGLEQPGLADGLAAMRSA